MSEYDPNDYGHESSNLRICSKTVDIDKVIEILIENGVSATVTSSKTIMRDKKKMWIENGCDIHIHGLKPDLFDKKLWTPLRDTFGLKCGYLTIQGRYMGCILNFIRESSCSCTFNREI